MLTSELVQCVLTSLKASIRGDFFGQFGVTEKPKLLLKKVLQTFPLPIARPFLTFAS